MLVKWISDVVIEILVPRHYLSAKLYKMSLRVCMVEAGASFDKKEFKRNVVGSVA
jgi:hypothetical protein